MGKLFIECEEKIKDLKKIANAVYEVLGQKDNLKAELVFVDAKEIKRLNSETRKVDSVTDVLSFPSLDGIKNKILKRQEYLTEKDGKYLFIGSIALNEERVKEQAIELGHSEEIERQYLIVHGLMHLMGYDHIVEEDKKEMRDKEKEALFLLGIEE